MNTHTQGEQLSAYLDGMLDVALTHRVARHLAACASCRASLEGLRQTQALLRGLRAPSLPETAFWTDTYRRMRVEGNSARQNGIGGWAWARWPRTTRQWAAGVAALVSLSALVTVPLVTTHGPGPGQPPVTVTEYGGGVGDFADITSLVRDHAASAARQPLADPDRQTMLAADVDYLANPADALGEAGRDATTADTSR